MPKASARIARADGNDEVVELLEGWLELARDGSMCHVALVAQDAEHMTAEWAGHSDLDYAVPFALDTLKIRMWEAVRLRAQKPKPVSVFFQPTKQTELHVCYDLKVNPLSPEFALWLANAEAMRLQENIPGPLKVAFANKALLKTERQRSVYANVFRPLISMIGAEEHEIPSDRADYAGRADFTFDAPKDIPPFKLNTKAVEYVSNMLKGEKVVTVSIGKSWKPIKDDRRVIYIRDLDDVGKPILGHETCPIASANPHIRMALYAQAEMNVFSDDSEFYCFKELLSCR